MKEYVNERLYSTNLFPANGRVSDSRLVRMDLALNLRKVLPVAIARIRDVVSDADEFVVVVATGDENYRHSYQTIIRNNLQIGSIRLRMKGKRKPRT